MKNATSIASILHIKHSSAYSHAPQESSASFSQSFILQSSHLFSLYPIYGLGRYSSYQIFCPAFVKVVLDLGWKSLGYGMISQLDCHDEYYFEEVT